MQIRAYKTNQSIIRQVNCRSYREEMLNETGENTPITALMQNKINAEINAYCSTCFYFYFTYMGDFNKKKTLKSQESINLTSNIKQNKCKIKFKQMVLATVILFCFILDVQTSTHTHTRLTVLCAGLPG